MSTLCNIFEYLDRKPRRRFGALVVHTALVVALMTAPFWLLPRPGW
jgi:hypothetical protein